MSHINTLLCVYVCMHIYIYTHTHCIYYTVLYMQYVQIYSIYRSALICEVWGIIDAVCTDISTLLYILYMWGTRYNRCSVYRYIVYTAVYWYVRYEVSIHCCIYYIPVHTASIIPRTSHITLLYILYTLHILYPVPHISVHCCIYYIPVHTAYIIPCTSHIRTLGNILYTCTHCIYYTAYLT